MCCGYLRWDGIDQPTHMHEHENVYTDMLHNGMIVSWGWMDTYQGLLSPICSLASASFFSASSCIRFPTS